jgi:hypothetical protein
MFRSLDHPQGARRVPCQHYMLKVNYFIKCFGDAAAYRLYFNMKVNKFVFINGSHKNQLEIADFLDHDNELTGFGTLYTKALRKKIQHIHANVHYYE